MKPILHQQDQDLPALSLMREHTNPFVLVQLQGHCGEYGRLGLRMS